jgi:rare lipoprotein A
MLSIGTTGMACTRQSSRNGRYLNLITMPVTVMLLAFLLAACGGGYRPQFNPAMATAGGVYKVGNPYKVRGRWYHPKEDPYYDRTGVASWYGPNFHGQPTANGETFDMNGFSAAHTTLPMPSYVKVTNLDNGRSLVLRVNDRGPFVDNRIIDLSRRAAQELGFAQRGTARVRVKAVREPVGERFVLARATTSRAERDLVIAAPAAAVRSEQLAPRSRPKPVNRPTLVASRAREFTPVSAEPARPDQLYVQAGAFSDLVNARQLQGELRGLGAIDLAMVTLGGAQYYRVRVGPLMSMEQAGRILTTIVNRGHPDARIVVDGDQNVCRVC